MDENATATFERVAQRVEPAGQLVRAWRLDGAASARLTALRVRLPAGESRTFVVRQHGQADREADPRIAAHEFELLQVLEVQGIPVPAPRFLDESGEVLPEPYIVIDYVDGDPPLQAEFAAEVARALALAIAKIHVLDVTAVDISFLPDQGERVATRLAKRVAARSELAVDEERACAVLRAAWPLSARNGRVLLHGDFWPGNVLWKDGSVVAIIDWEDAAIGDPLIDVANCRLELLWAFGRKIMVEFTEHYRRAMRGVDFGDLPY